MEPAEGNKRAHIPDITRILGIYVSCVVASSFADRIIVAPLKLCEDETGECHKWYEKCTPKPLWKGVWKGHLMVFGIVSWVSSSTFESEG